jgi:ankyrin repeat protein
MERSLTLLSRFVFCCAMLLGGIGGASAAAAASDRCLELARRFDTLKSQISAIEVSLTLFSAVDGGCADQVRQLLDFGASVNARDRLGARPLSHAAKSGHLEVVDLLLARGAPIDARNLAGATALFFAAQGGHEAIVERLVAGGADINLKGRSGVSPLSAAAYAGHDAIVAMLLDRGADYLTPDDTGKPAIVYAAAAGHNAIVERLLARKVDVNARYANDLTLLMWASGPDDAVPEATAVTLVSSLLDAGARIDDQDARGRTALMIAAEGGRGKIVDVLLAHGADRSHTDKGGKRAADLTVVSALRERLGQP